MPVPTAGRVSVEDVRRTLGSDAERVDVRPAPGVNSVPAGSARLILIGPSGLAIGRAQLLVVLCPGPRFCQFCPRTGLVGIRPADPKMPLRPFIAGPVAVRPV
jgi:hypothetical protein